MTECQCQPGKYFQQQNGYLTVLIQSWQVLGISGITEKTRLIVDYSTLKIIKVTDADFDGVEREISNISNLPTNIFIKCEIKYIWP